MTSQWPSSPPIQPDLHVTNGGPGVIGGANEIVGCLCDQTLQG